MGKIFKSWLFFTALLILLLTAAATLPKLPQRLFGTTEETVETAFYDLGQEVKAVWASLTP